LVAFAEDNARVLLPRAYLDDCGCWADGILRGGALDVDKSWWIFAELDQLAGTLALRDPTFLQYLPRAYDYWFRHFVDPVYGEVWNGRGWQDPRAATPVAKAMAMEERDSGTMQGVELATDDQGRQTQKITFSNVH
jgi:hypothetical protein